MEILWLYEWGIIFWKIDVFIVRKMIVEYNKCRIEWIYIQLRIWLYLTLKTVTGILTLDDQLVAQS